MRKGDLYKMAFTFRTAMGCYGSLAGLVACVNVFYFCSVGCLGLGVGDCHTGLGGSMGCANTERMEGGGGEYSFLE
jgi:hypothetical protein